jgi:hypothetical protein
MNAKDFIMKIIYDDLFKNIDNNIYHHGTTSKKLIGGEHGIHIGTKLAAKIALESKIGIPVNGEWDGSREYGKTLLAGKKTLQKMNFSFGYDPIMNFNATDDVPEEDYYPKQRKKRAVYYSTNELIPLDSKPNIIQVRIIGPMVNSYDKPYSDAIANGLMDRSIKAGNAKRGYYYINKYEDVDNVSAVVPDKSFLEII